MKNYNYLKIFTIIGLTIGVLDGIGIMIYSYVKVPSFPSIYEVLVQFAIILMNGLLFAFYGFIVGMVIRFINKQVRRKKSLNT